MDADASRLASGNSELANKRLQRWKRHVETIAKQLDQIRQRIGRGQLHGKDKIGVRVGKVLNKYKVGKQRGHLDLGPRPRDTDPTHVCAR